MHGGARFLVAVTLLPAILVACGDDDDPSYSVIVRLVGPIGSGGDVSRHWTFNVSYYRYGLPDRTCVVHPYDAEVVFPPGGVIKDCSSGCIFGPACGFGCKVDLQDCAVWSGDVAPIVKVFYKNIDCPKHIGLNSGLVLAFPSTVDCDSSLRPAG
jgi:hypothetical protein